MRTAKETILKEARVLYATTFPVGTIIYKQPTFENFKMACGIKIPAPQKILDQCVVQMQLTASAVLFPANTIFYYKVEQGAVEYASQNVPNLVSLQEQLSIVGFLIPASSKFSFLVNASQAFLGEEGEPDSLQANNFSATMLISLKESIVLGQATLREKTHLYLTAKELSWSYFGEDGSQHEMQEKGVLMDFKTQVEQVLETKNLGVIEYEALHYLSTSYFKTNIERASTLLGHYYKHKKEKTLAAKYYHQAYCSVVVEESNREKMYQLDDWISKLRLGISITEKRHSLRKLYMFNVFLIVVLFYAGVHLNEEEKAFLADLRPNQDAYEWATFFYAVLGLLCSLFALYVGVRTLSTMRRVGIVVGLLSVAGFIYSMVVLVYAETLNMEGVLLVYGPYLVISMWLNAYVMMLRN